MRCRSGQPGRQGAASDIAIVTEMARLAGERDRFNLLFTKEKATVSSSPPWGEASSCEGKRASFQKTMLEATRTTKD